MSQWTHPICDDCWEERGYSSNGAREPVRTVDREWERCCFCGLETLSGIYVREDPLLLVRHREHENW